MQNDDAGFGLPLHGRGVLCSLQRDVAVARSMFDQAGRTASMVRAPVSRRKVMNSTKRSPGVGCFLVMRPSAALTSRRIPSRSSGVGAGLPLADAAKRIGGDQPLAGCPVEWPVHDVSTTWAWSSRFSSSGGGR